MKCAAHLKMKNLPTKATKSFSEEIEKISNKSRQKVKALKGTAHATM